MTNVLRGNFTSEVSEEITQLGEALLAEKDRRLASRTIPLKTGLPSAEQIRNSDYPELGGAFRLTFQDHTHVALFHDGRDPKAFTERPLAMQIDLAKPLRPNRRVSEWIKEALVGAGIELRGRFESERSRDHVILASYAKANAAINLARGKHPQAPSFELSNYRARFNEKTGFHYVPGFTVAIRFPNLLVSSASENGTEMESRVVVRGLSLSTMADPTNLSPLFELTKAIRARMALPPLQVKNNQAQSRPTRRGLHMVGGSAKREV